MVDDYTERIHSIRRERVNPTGRSGFHAGIGNTELSPAESVARTVNIQPGFHKHDEEIDRRDVLLPRCLPSSFVRVVMIFYANAETSMSVSGCFVLNVPCLYIRSVTSSLRN